MTASRQAFLDANVIRGQLSTDVLLSLASSEAFTPRWSRDVLDEMRRNRPAGVSEASIDHRIATMNRAFPDAIVTGYEHLVSQMQADDKDRHVLAAAVHSRSDLLVTENTKDFQPPTSGPHTIRVERTSEFLDGLLRAQPEVVNAALEGMVKRNKWEPRTMPELIDRMVQQTELAGFARNLNAVVSPGDRGGHPALRTGNRQTLGHSGDRAASPGSLALDGVSAVQGAVERGPEPVARPYRPDAPDPQRGRGHQGPVER